MHNEESKIDLLKKNLRKLIRQFIPNCSEFYLVSLKLTKKEDFGKSFQVMAKGESFQESIPNIQQSSS